MGKAIPLSEFLGQQRIEDLDGPTPLKCLVLKERLGIADDRWSYVCDVFDLCMCCNALSAL